ncbi:MAG: RNA-binding protein [Alphaproteobacteria bacterium]|nr:RNA-binding protein [Alphaproteobacteria bacterium]
MTQNETTRKCIASGQVLEKQHLLRFVAIPDGTIVPDFKKRLPGKGIYVSISKTMLNKAIKNNLFSKALKQKVNPIENLENMVEDILRLSSLKSISLARKAGFMISGLDKVSDAIKKNKVAFLLEAYNAGTDGTEKISRLAGNIQIYRLFTTEELDKALDKTNTVHCAFLKSEMSNAVSREFDRLNQFLNS